MPGFRTNAALVSVLLTTIPATAAPGQTQAPATLDRGFDRFSVVLSASRGHDAVIRELPQSDGFVAVNATAETLIAVAYRVRPSQIVGAPSWAAHERFDVVARTTGNESPDGPNGIMRLLLTQRFGLLVRPETALSTTYVLSSGAESRVRLSTTADCRQRAHLLPSSESVPEQECGVTIVHGHLSARGVTSGELARGLSVVLNRDVVDETGLVGRFDAELDTTSGRSIATLVGEQLGLILRTERRPVNLLIVNRIRRPSADGRGDRR
jgi:uncharacterized protein (TIGR03435 family)